MEPDQDMQQRGIVCLHRQSSQNLHGPPPLTRDSPHTQNCTIAHKGHTAECVQYDGLYATAHTVTCDCTCALLGLEVTIYHSFMSSQVSDTKDEVTRFVNSFASCSVTLKDLRHFKRQSASDMSSQRLWSSTTDQTMHRMGSPGYT